MPETHGDEPNMALNDIFEPICNLNSQLHDDLVKLDYEDEPIYTRMHHVEDQGG